MDAGTPVDNCRALSAAWLGKVLNSLDTTENFDGAKGGIFCICSKKWIWKEEHIFEQLLSVEETP